MPATKRAVSASARRAKRANTGSRGGGAAWTSPFKRPIAAKYRNLIDMHSAAVTCAALMQKRGIHPTMKLLRGFVENSTGGQEFTERQLKQIATIDSEAVQLRVTSVLDEEGDVRDELVIIFGLGDGLDKKTFHSIQKMQATVDKLKERFKVRLYSYVANEFSSYAKWLNSNPVPGTLEAEIAVEAPDIPEFRLRSGRSESRGAKSAVASSQSRSIKTLVEEDWYKDQIVHVEVVKEVKPDVTRLSLDLNEKVLRGCEALNIDPVNGLYKHQVEAVTTVVRDKKDIVIATATSSGKSLCYNIVAGEFFASDENATALYLFPTKALARDQLRAAQDFFVKSKLLQPDEVLPFDGDVEHGYQRVLVKNKARLILANPDILHVTVLPNFSTWQRFLSGLRLLVVDEAHMYRGAFGIHCSMVFRRLLSITESAYSTVPRIVFCSATVANPVEHAERLSGRRKVRMVSEDGSPKAARTILVWNPPLKVGAENEDEPTEERGVQEQWRESANVKGSKSLRRSAMFQTARILNHLMACDKRIIAFSASRKLVEITLKTVHELLDESGMSNLKSQIRSYRGGYTKTERRKLESALKSGSIQAVISTNALELGIDIGDLEVSVHLGFPGSISSLRQQIGRAGRVLRREPSISVLILQDSPMDQHYSVHAERLFSDLPESVVIDPSNGIILKRHLVCALSEKSVRTEDDVLTVFGASGIEQLMNLVNEEKVTYVEDEERSIILTDRGMAVNTRFSIRFIDDEQVSVQVENTDNILEQMEKGMAMFFVHPGAIYLNSGKSYMVKTLDYDSGIAAVRELQASPGYYTSILDKTRVWIQSEKQRREIKLQSGKENVLGVHFGVVDVETTVYAYNKVNILTGFVEDKVEVNLPPLKYTTSALWIDVPSRQNFPDLSEEDFFAGLHTLEHLFRSLSPLFVLMDPSDIAGWPVVSHRGTGRPQVFIYETVPEGVGLIQDVFEKHVESILVCAMERLETCECGNTQSGCPSCIQMTKCGYYNDNLDKKVATDIMKKMIPANHTPVFSDVKPKRLVSL